MVESAGGRGRKKVKREFESGYHIWGCTAVDDTREAAVLSGNDIRDVAHFLSVERDVRKQSGDTSSSTTWNLFDAQQTTSKSFMGKVVAYLPDPVDRRETPDPDDMGDDDFLASEDEGEANAQSAPE